MIYNTWLAQLCAMLPQVRAAAVCIAGQNDALATWHTESSPPLCLDEWSALVQAANTQHSPLVTMPAGGDANALRVVFPLQHAKSDHLLVVLELAASTRQQTAILQILEWGDAWLGLLQSTSATGRASHELPAQGAGQSAQGVWRCIEQGLLSRDADGAAYVICRELASALSCQQVALVCERGKGLVLQALSTSPQFDARSHYAQHLQTLARNASVQAGATLHAMAQTETMARLANAGPLRWYYLPLHYSVSGAVPWHGGILFAREASASLSADLERQLHALQPALAAVMALHARVVDTMPALIKALAERMNPWRAWQTKRRWPRVLAVVCVALMLAALWTRPHQIDAPVSIEALSQRAVVAPFDGFVAAAERRAGEHVAQGDTLARLNDRALRLEQQRWLGQQDEFEKQYRQALARREQAEANIFAAQLAQAKAQLALVEERLQQTDLRAPIAGIIVEGDLSRALGAPVQQGKVLFEVAPLNAYRAVFRLSARDLAFLDQNQQGELQLKAFPQQRWRVSISQRAAIYHQDASSSWYRVEAQLEGSTEALRPGMEGWGKITVGERSVLWLLGHQLLDWWRVQIWRWWP